MRTQPIHKAIQAYARQVKKYGRSNLDRLEQIQRKFEREETDRIKARKLMYPAECQAISSAMNEIQAIFNHYFGRANAHGIIAGYDWHTGNDNLKNLIK